MKSTRLTLFLLITMNLATFAQDTIPFHRSRPATVPEKSRSRFIDHVYLGGYLGLQFGTVTYIDISPMAIYQFTKNLYSGLGGTYQYIRNKYYEPAYSSSAYGANLMVRYHIWKDLFLQAEYDPLYLSYYPGYNTLAKKDYTWVHDVLAGVGYRQWLAQRAFLTIAIFYNLNETYYSPYENPIIRFSFGIGL